MNINTSDINSPSGFYPVKFETFAETLDESKISYSIDMGAVTLHYGTRHGLPIWLMDNPLGTLYGIWVGDHDAEHAH
jgi:hypothetical protein